ncbi:MAG: 23S rRNA (adenine(2030)-N(6))-methyltransferase RlmJ [Oleiphilus sp.]
MLSYRHAFHAGNHADVIKHLTLVLCCEYFCQKNKAFHYIDTHAGAGLYDLKSEAATKNNEHRRGIEVLLNQANIPAAFNRYIELIQQSNKAQTSAYPGSPWFAGQLLRPHDQATLFEMHPTDFSLLAKLFSGNRRIKVKQADGFQSLKSLMPPASRRAITLIDPPYEQEKEYQAVIQTLEDGISRFSTGTYIVWYPLINRSGSSKQIASNIMLKQIKSKFAQEQLHIQYIQDSKMQGMYGSGLAIINPPWVLEDKLREALNFLCSLDDTNTQTFSIEPIAAKQGNSKR